MGGPGPVRQEVATQRPVRLGMVDIICLEADSRHVRIAIFDTVDPEGREVRVPVGAAFQAGHLTWVYEKYAADPGNEARSDPAGTPLPGVNAERVTFVSWDERPSP